MGPGGAAMAALGEGGGRGGLRTQQVKQITAGQIRDAMDGVL